MTAHHTLPPGDRLDLEEALEELADLRAHVGALARAREADLALLPEATRASARNLVHYLALRTRNLEAVQRRLAGHGLSSLGRAEAHVLANLDAVLGLLRCVLDRPPPEPYVEGVAFDEGERLRRARTDALFGPPPPRRGVRIVATMPAEAARDPGLVRALLAGGMDCMRINCAHDGPEAWAAMIANLRAAEAEQGRSCRVLMDLPGPRVRTGALEPGPRVVKVGPQRDEEGRVVRPAIVWLVPEDVAPPAGGDAVLPVPASFVAVLQPGDRLRLVDARGAKRRLKVAESSAAGARCTLFRTAYVRTGTVLRTRGGQAVVGDLPPVPRRIPLGIGEMLILTAEQAPGRPARRDPEGTVLEAARIPCAPPEPLRRVEPGDRVSLDDGRLGGVVRGVDAEGVHLQVTRAPRRARLGAEKGINFPDTEMGLPALTEEDLRILPFVCEHADLVGYSFARSAADVRHLREALEDCPRRPGIVLKIETPAAFQELPRMLLEALHSPVAGVMIARGDLAVESGFERLAELQEEILCLCEAAHVPVIWATQVLEQLAQHGTPSRAEVSDAALGERSEGVMLNKGPYLTEAVRMLDDILSRMGRHQEKKRPLLARLGVAERFFFAPAADGEAVGR